MPRLRSLLSCSLVPALLGLAHCSGSSSPTAIPGPGTGGTDSGAPASGGGDTGAPGMVDAPGMADAGSGTMMDSGRAGDDASMNVLDSGALACMSPAGCTSGIPVCCATINLTGGSIPNCTAGAVSSACTSDSSCATALPASCTGMLVVRLCAQNSDCTESGNPACCSFMEGAQSLNFCSNTAIAALAGGHCM